MRYHQGMTSLLILLISLFFVSHGGVTSFQPTVAVKRYTSNNSSQQYRSTATASKRFGIISLSQSSVSEDTTVSSTDELEKLKQDLLQYCSTTTTKPSLQIVKDKVQDLEELAEQIGIGQASSSSGLLNGEWELVYAPQDNTRSSPFFWAFSQAFPDSADQIYTITDTIPSPIKDIGPAYQTIDMDARTLVSRVKISTLNQLASSIMTTRCTIINTSAGLDGVILQVDSTKPEQSSILEKFGGPLGKMISENSSPFPSGEALEAVKVDSSKVVMITSFCDEGLRVSRNADDAVFVWKRKSFGDSTNL